MLKLKYFLTVLQRKSEKENSISSLRVEKQGFIVSQNQHQKSFSIIWIKTWKTI